MAVNAAALTEGPRPVAPSAEQSERDRWNKISEYSINPPLRPGRFLGRDTYETNLAVQLRLRFLELHDTFCIVCGQQAGDGVFAAPAEILISDMFENAQVVFEQERANLLGVAHLLEAINRYMVWLLPDYTMRYAIINTLTDLQAPAIPGKEKYVKQLTEWVDKPDAYFQEADRLRNGRIALYEARGAISTHNLQEQINNRLQIRRLGGLWWWGLIVLLIFFVISPLITNLAIFRGTANEWPAQQLYTGAGAWQAAQIAWLNALGITVVGMVSGFLSGLIQARHSHVKLVQYQEDRIKLYLKPLVGGLVALVLYTFLTWGILPGVKIESMGSYFLIAFLAGFSERYFLRTLQILPQGKDVNKRVTHAAERADV